MKIEVQVEFVDQTEMAAKLIGLQIKRMVEAGAIIMADEVRAVMNESDPSGRSYTIPGTKTKYTASAPGQPPAERETTYAGSWQHSPATSSGGQITAYAWTSRRVGKADEHNLGYILEYGSDDGRIEPRPHARIAARRTAKKLKGKLR